MRCCAAASAASGQSPCLCGAASTSKRSQRTLQVCDTRWPWQKWSIDYIYRLKGKSIGNQRKPWYKSMIFYDFLCISDEIYWNMRFWEMIITLWHHEHVGFCFWLSIVLPRPLKASGWKSPLRMRILGGSDAKHGASIFAWYMMCILGYIIYQISYIKYHISNIIYQISYIKYHISYCNYIIYHIYLYWYMYIIIYLQ